MTAPNPSASVSPCGLHAEKQFGSLGDIELPILTADHYQAIEQRVRQSIIDHHVQLLTIAGVEANAKYATLASVVPTGVTPRDTWLWCENVSNALSVISMSLKMKGVPDVDGVIAKIRVERQAFDIIDLALVLLGAKVRESIAERNARFVKEYEARIKEIATEKANADAGLKAGEENPQSRQPTAPAGENSASTGASDTSPSTGSASNAPAN